MHTAARSRGRRGGGRQEQCVVAAAASGDKQGESRSDRHPERAADVPSGDSQTDRQTDAQNPPSICFFLKKTYGVFVCTFWGLFLTAANNTTTTPTGWTTDRERVAVSLCRLWSLKLLDVSNAPASRGLQPTLSLALENPQARPRGLPAFSKRPRSRSRSLHAEAHEGIQCIEILFV